MGPPLLPGQLLPILTEPALSPFLGDSAPLTPDLSYYHGDRTAISLNPSSSVWREALDPSRSIAPGCAEGPWCVAADQNSVTSEAFPSHFGIRSIFLTLSRGGQMSAGCPQQPWWQPCGISQCERTSGIHIPHIREISREGRWE